MIFKTMMTTRQRKFAEVIMNPHVTLLRLLKIEGINKVDAMSEHMNDVYDANALANINTAISTRISAVFYKIASIRPPKLRGSLLVKYSGRHSNYL